MRFADIACGSGSFLLGVYDYLLRYHTTYYNSYGKKEIARAAGCLENADGSFTLSIAQRREILRNNVFGVDVDAQAVEVAQLSLALKLLEDATTATARAFQPKLGEKILPDMTKNIVCGNSLIDYDILDGQLFERDEERRLNAMSYEDKFPEIMRGGGFDAIVGNPPYSYMIDQIQQNYFARIYGNQNYQKDLYLLFLEKYEKVLKSEGLLGVIVSNTWLQSITLRSIRQYLATTYNWLRILHLPEKVFSAIVDTHVLIFENVKQDEIQDLIVDVRRNGNFELLHTLPKSAIATSGDVINVIASYEAQQLCKKVSAESACISDICQVLNGIKPFEKGKGKPPQTVQTMKEKPFVFEGDSPSDNWSPLLRGSLIERYANRWKKNYWVLYGEWLAAPRDPEIFTAPLKIMVRQTGDSIIAALIEDGFIARNNLHILLPKTENYNLRYILGVLNSKLVDFVYSILNPERGEALAEVKKNHVEQLPIRTINFDDADEKAAHDKMVALVEQMLDAKKHWQAARTDRDKTFYQGRCNALDRQIDKSVYRLYDLTADEMKIVEGAA